MENLSIVICTYNRSNILKEAILSIVNNSSDLEKYEILIIDNNSNDDTFNISTELMNSYENIKYYKEEKQGLSVARNTGIKKANNEIIVFLDDDILVNNDFVDNLLKFFRNNKDAICGGGKIDTIWSKDRPSWFNEGFFSIIGETKYGEKTRELVGNEYPYGGNMFLKKFIFNEIGFFDENLGLNGDEIKMGEEVDLFVRIKSKGYKIYYEPTVSVEHRVHLNKINKQYVIKRWLEEGKATGIILSGKNYFFNKLKRLMILYLRDYPNWILSKLRKSTDEFYYFAKIVRGKEIMKYLKK